MTGITENRSFMRVSWEHCRYQLQIMLDKAKGYGYKNCGFILDRGYFSKANIRFMDKERIRFHYHGQRMKSLVRRSYHGEAGNI